MIKCPCESSAQGLHAQIPHPQVPSWTCSCHQQHSEPFMQISAIPLSSPFSSSHSNLQGPVIPWTEEQWLWLCSLGPIGITENKMQFLLLCYSNMKL